MSKSLSDMSIEELWQLFPIILTEHKDEWADWYNDEYSYLCKILDCIQVKRINHIGSTAINGIWSKPTVDILIEIPREYDINEVKKILMHNGYTCMSQDEKRVSFNKGYTENGFAERVFHLHLRFDGDNDELYFRDFMNENLVLATQYKELKLCLWKKYEHNRDGYTEAKGSFIRECTQKAKEKYGARYV